jgi:hypothetical protein
MLLIYVHGNDVKENTEQSGIHFKTTRQAPDQSFASSQSTSRDLSFINHSNHHPASSVFSNFFVGSFNINNEKTESLIFSS